MSFIARRALPQLARSSLPSARSASTHAVPHDSHSSLKITSDLIPVEAYPLIFLCITMPVYGVIAGVNAVKDGGATGYLRLLPHRFQPTPKAVVKNVWED